LSLLLFYYRYLFSYIKYRLTNTIEIFADIVVRKTARGLKQHHAERDSNSKFMKQSDINFILHFLSFLRRFHKQQQINQVIV